MIRVWFLIFVLCWSTTMASSMRYIRLGTGPSEGNYFKIGSLLSSVLSKPPGSRSCDRGGYCGLLDSVFTTRSTKGSSENVQLLLKGDIDLGFIQKDVYVSLSQADKAKVHVCGPLFYDQPHLVVRAKEGIHNLEDLKGKTIAFGSIDLGVLQSMAKTLEDQGLLKNTYKMISASPGQTADFLDHHKADAAFYISNYPVPSVTTLSHKTSLRCLSFKPHSHPEITIPKNTYEHLDSFITYGIPVLLVARAHVDPERLNHILDLLWHPTNQKYLKERWKGGAFISKDKWDKEASAYEHGQGR